MGFTVITTIQAPTPALMRMVEGGVQHGMRTVVVGDRKSPHVTWPNGADFFSLSDQRNLGFALTALLPENHYARKNIGYLLAMSRGGSVIFDTDDDNAPLASWRRRTPEAIAQPCRQSGWINVYQWFTPNHIWPRGFPLEKVRSSSGRPELGVSAPVFAPIQQGLANGSPDVDAVWRLTLDEDIRFQDNGSVYLPAGAWCPFNSQACWWFPEAYPLMYLPSHVSFRMTDIWRSFIAQRCLWEMGCGIVFHGPEMEQTRNPHNLLRDFEQEIPGYLGNAGICEVLERVQLSGEPNRVGENLHRCYEVLIAAGFVSAAEMPMVEAWLRDISGMYQAE